jgi:hypothetical protein
MSTAKRRRPAAPRYGLWYSNEQRYQCVAATYKGDEDEIAAHAADFEDVIDCPTVEAAQVEARILIANGHKPYYIEERFNLEWDKRGWWTWEDACSVFDDFSAYYRNATTT